MMPSTKKKEESFAMTVGSSYLVRSVDAKDKPLETRGKLRGYASIGQETALAMELDESYGDMKGKLRFIPLNVIMSVDVIKAVDKPDDKGKDGPESVYFG
jgi:hypothetical protein